VKSATNKELQSIFDEIYRLLLKKKALDKYQVFKKTIPVLLDGAYCKLLSVLIYYLR